MKIKDALTIDLSEDIKNVIDLEDFSETEIQAEIENYIVTDGLAREYANFAGTFTSNIVETGVWISGFYGSGKSYFAKLLGYLLSDRIIVGTPARDRILQRFTGISDEALIKNSVAKLHTQNCRIVFLDVAKQDTSKGLAFTLFRNFMKSLELPENEHGFLLYQLMINENQWNIHEYIYQKINKNWSYIKSRLIEYVKASKTIYLMQDNNDSDYENVLTTIRRDIDQFSASRLREELTNYGQIKNDEKIVFLFDEASEAINKGKFSLLDLEGISEALSSLGGTVWTIAIAQERLDDIIRNSNISRAQLTKVTDRFKTKIHLEATEVDVIIRSRLLKKHQDALDKIHEHYKKNSGKISDHAALSATGINKTDSSESYLTYYPFYKYQFDLMQNFLFGTKGYASTKVAARGMIITTYDILKRELQDENVFYVATGWQIAHQAQPQPPVRLVSRYDNADKILRETGSTISGRKLLETLHFLTEAEVVPTTLQNIAKMYVAEPEDIHKIQADLSKALNDLVEAKIILPVNNTYRITTDIEQRLLDEMVGFLVQGFVKKKQVMSVYKSSTMIKTSARITENSLQYEFYITTDNDDELTKPNLKQLKLKIKSLYSISDDRASDIEALKTQHQNDKDLIWIVPDNSFFKEIDKLIDEIERISYLEQNYNNPQSEEAPIIRNFITARTEKENRVKELIELSLKGSTVVYLFNTYQLTKDNWNSTMQEQQRQVIQNVYHKRLESQLSDKIAAAVIKEANNERLQTYFHGKDFQFFDTQGNFIGGNLRVVEEILFKIKNTFVDGATLEKELEIPPTGFPFGTVISTVAALMRAGKIMAKYSGSEKYSWRDEGVPSLFAAAREFRKASFKAIAKSLTAQQKNDIVTALQELNCKDTIKRKIDWNSNDFDLGNAVRDLAKCYCDKVDTLRKSFKGFDTLFPAIEKQKDILADYTGTVSERNYIEKAEAFLAGKPKFTTAVNAIEKVEKFIGNNLPKVQQWHDFCTDVNDEFTKAASTNATITPLCRDFHAGYRSDVVKNFASLQQTVQKVKDEYYTLMKNAASDMATKYIQLKKNAEAVLEEINSLPAGLNTSIAQEVNSIVHYAEQRIQKEVEIDFDVKEKHSHFTYSEMLSFIELYNKKNVELEIAKASLQRERPPAPEPGTPLPARSVKTFSSKIPGSILKVGEYKQWLHQELQKLAEANDDDTIKLNKD
ncbi:MAG: BREX system P-loop protein BrxC [bacterium]